MITSPTPGTFVIALHFKGRDKPIVEMDLKIDDLLEKASENLRYPDCHANDYRYQQKESNTMLDLEYVQLHVSKILALLNKVSVSRRTAMFAYTLFAAFRQTTIDLSARRTAIRVS
jgi:Ras GTPase-activating-like protein IQGAP2/3